MADELGTVVGRIATNGQLLNQQIGQLIQTLTNLLPFAGSLGTFTSAAAAATVVADTNVQANSHIDWTPTNAAAATLDSGATAYYVSARTIGVSFTLTTANAAAAAGTETWTFIVMNPSA